MPALTRNVFATALVILTLGGGARASTRTVETHFALAADARSEFSTRFPLLSAGRLVIEADWSSKTANGVPVLLTIELIRPDGSLAARNNGRSVLRLEQAAGEPDIEKFASINDGQWTVKILNDGQKNRNEVSGTLRITIPVVSRPLEDTQFTLLGSGNAQEIPFKVPAPGRIEVSVSWEPDLLARPSDQVTLVVSLIHPGESRTYARRQGTSPIRVEQQVTESTLDLGLRWIVRVQNDTQTRVGGSVKIVYTPSL